MKITTKGGSTSAIVPEERTNSRRLMPALPHAGFTPRIFNSGYSLAGASYAKKSLIGWKASSSNADDDIVENIETLRQRSRSLFMGTPIAAGAIKTVRTNVVGSGLTLNARIDAKYLGLSDEQAQAWEANTEREWRLWAESVNCDAERRQTFYQLQSLVFLSALMSGDCFVLMPMVKRPGCPYDLRIGIIEADRVYDPPFKKPEENILGGIEVGKYGEAKAVYIWNRAQYATPRSIEEVSTKPQRIPIFGEKSGRRNVLHIMTDVERPCQRRGTPMLAPVIEQLKQLGRYTDAELMSAVISSMFTVFIKSQSPHDFAGGLGYALPEEHRYDPDPSAIELGNATICALQEGEDVVFADPKRPNQAFEAYVTALCRYIGTALEVPYELLLKHFTASYSASRAALLEAWKTFRMRREWLISSFCQPVYEEWLSEAVAKGRITAPGFFTDPAVRVAWCGASWAGDAQGQLDPQKEVEAANLRIKYGFSTITREAAELSGMRFEDIVATRKREIATMREAGVTVDSLPSPAPQVVESGGSGSQEDEPASDEEDDSDTEDDSDDKEEAT